ncbi:MAG: diacylglycerol kinase family protein [Desulfosarcinaceae bacterium]|nr:diacylglycerol kinase family protein [Desulfosarcinaceae bacterium]
MRPSPPADAATGRIALLANPASGSLPPNRRYAALKRAAAVLRAQVYGLDTATAQEFAQCARDTASRCDLLVVAGGDGSFSLVINAVDLSTATLAFLPFGTGNALSHALGYRGSIEEIAARLLAGRPRNCDLIDCDGRTTAFMVSLGIDGCAIEWYERYKRRGYRGLNAHLRAGLSALVSGYRPVGARIDVDGAVRRVRRLYSLMVMKQPFFGMGLEVVPRARWDDGRLHTQTFATGYLGLAAGLITGFTIGNRSGAYRPGRRVHAALDAPRSLQIDGEVGWRSDRFDFRLLPGALRLRF